MDSHNLSMLRSLMLAMEASEADLISSTSSSDFPSMESYLNFIMSSEITNSSSPSPSSSSPPPPPPVPAADGSNRNLFQESQSKFGGTAVEEVVSQYLRSKLSSILQAADADPNSPSHIVSHFRSIDRQITFMCETTNTSSSPTVVIPVDLLYDLIDALSDCRIFAHQRHKSAGFFFFISEFFSKKKMGKQLDAFETRLKNIQPPPPPAGDRGSRLVVIQQTYPLLDPSRIFGFDSYAEKIERLLLDNPKSDEHAVADGITAIGIVGRCGCGKTALAQKVFASLRIQDEYAPRIWVCLSKMLFGDNSVVDTRVRVLNYILEELGHDILELEYADSNVIKLLEKLQRGLIGKRYLIVLDNAWRFDDFYGDLSHRLPRGYATGEFLSHGLPKGSGGGGALILTSRSENVIRRTVGDKHVIRLEPHLSDEICRKIFTDVVREQGRIEMDHRTLEKIEDDVVRNCDGLPLAATTLADIISELLDENLGHGSSGIPTARLEQEFE